jgi:hypothetical protein
MKLFKIFVLFFTIITIGFASCKKDPGNSKVSVGSDKMSATIGNKKYDLTITEINKIKRGDTVTISFTGISKDSSIKVGIALVNQVGIQVKKYYFKGNPFLSDTILEAVFGVFTHSSQKTDTTYMSIGDSTKGLINVLEYSENTEIQGSYNFTAKSLDDSTKVVSVKGEFNGSLVDPQTKISDLPVPLGRMTARINNASSNLSVIAVKDTFYGLYTLNITGVHDPQSIVLQFVNFKPVFGSKYKIDSTQLNSDTKVTASFDDGKITYLADGSGGTSGEINIVKLTAQSIQGKFSFIGADIKKPGSKATITEGMFNARFKNYGK